MLTCSEIININKNNKSKNKQTKTLTALKQKINSDRTYSESTTLFLCFYYFFIANFYTFKCFYWADKWQIIISHFKPSRTEDLVRKRNFSTFMEIMNFKHEPRRFIVLLTWKSNKGRGLEAFKILKVLCLLL